MANWPASAPRCPWHGSPCLRFHYVLCCHQRHGHSHDYEAPISVRLLDPPPFSLAADTTRISIGAKSVQVLEQTDTLAGETIHPIIFLDGRSLVCR